ncbi:hypothetical protein Btru_009527 [Bulinus truncatus]|nr:hypothetical protein Btru_009527 [Bulinus truncatus]
MLGMGGDKERGVLEKGNRNIYVDQNTLYWEEGSDQNTLYREEGSDQNTLYREDRGPGLVMVYSLTLNRDSRFLRNVVERRVDGKLRGGESDRQNGGEGCCINGA